MFAVKFSVNLFLIAIALLCYQSRAFKEGCHLKPVIHVLKHPGCVPKPIPSFACQGSCSSYVQISGSKFWSVERSCMCCQEMGEREAAVTLYCPDESRKFRKIKTQAPMECMCRPCTGVDEENIKPQEILNLLTNGVEPRNLPPLR